MNCCSCLKNGGVCCRINLCFGQWRSYVKLHFCEHIKHLQQKTEGWATLLFFRH